MTDASKRIDQCIGERIRLRRAELGMTQEQLASALGLSYQQVQKYESGANRISASRLYEVAQQLGVSVGGMFSGLDEAEAETPPLEHGGRHRAAIELARSFGRINDTDVRAAIAGLVKTLTHERPG